MNRTGKSMNWRGFAVIIAMSFILCLVVGCGGDSDKQEGEETSGSDFGREYYANWLKYRSKYFELRYAPNEEVHERMKAIGDRMDEVLLFNSMVLRTKPPDSIFVMLFENRIEGNKVTGGMLPYFSNDTIYYDLMAPIGKAISDLMLHKAAKDTIRFDFLAEGYPTMLDFSGQNYHQMAQQFFDRKEGYTAMQLIDNEIFNSMTKNPRRILSASFIAYLTYTYGSAPMVGLLRMDGTSKEILEATTKKSIEELHAEWEKAVSYTHLRAHET